MALATSLTCLLIFWTTVVALGTYLFYLFYLLLGWFSILSINVLRGFGKNIIFLIESSFNLIMSLIFILCQFFIKMIS
jgi:hypothetical protein